MRRSSIFLATVCTMAAVLMASRCADPDDDKLPVSASVEPASPLDLSGAGMVDGGIDKDPLGDVMSAPDGVSLPDGVGLPDGGLPDGGNAPLDLGGSGDSMLDDQTFEPQPVPEGSVDVGP